MTRFVFFFFPLLALILAACSGTAAKTPAAQVNASANAGESSGTASSGTASSGTAAGGDALARADEQGAVTVTVTPINLSSPGDTLDFDVSLQTHMVDLSMDIASLSTLKTDTGVTIKGTAWDGPKGGHHVMGKLSFPASQDGKPVLEGAKTLTLTIRDVDAAERTFSWDITR